MLTIRQTKGKVQGLTIGSAATSTWAHGHSLRKRCRYPRNRFVLISPPELEIPDYIISRVFKPAGVSFTQCRRLEEAIGDLDILYMTRVQKERFFNEQDYVRLKDSYILDAEKCARPQDLTVLHPLPRVNEISTKSTPTRAPYFPR